jgi:3-hydroxyacyl-CoA dehydrogenase/enoyl-CoA hydratase/3-hydroxybutyryl-CoA epimerase
MSLKGYSLEIDASGIATVRFDLPGKVNIMNDDFMIAMPRLLEDLEDRRSSLRGVVLTSHKATFFAGGDLALMRRAQKGQERFLQDHFDRLKRFLRRLELLDRPLVAAINGTALGGGYELCLACHHRIALASDRARIGLPKVNFGILPAAGGVIRLTALLGFQAALGFLLTGRTVEAGAALQSGLVDEVVDTHAALIGRAKDWILANRDAKQPWDRREIVSPRQSMEEMTRWREDNLKHSGLAANRIADVAARSLYLDFHTASRIETEGFVELVLTEEAHKLISAFFDANKTRRAS